MGCIMGVCVFVQLYNYQETFISVFGLLVQLPLVVTG